MRDKLADIARRHAELTARMGDPGLFDVPGAYQKVATEVARLDPLVKAFLRFEAVGAELVGARELLHGADDAELRALARGEVDALLAEHLPPRRHDRHPAAGNRLNDRVRVAAPLPVAVGEVRKAAGTTAAVAGARMFELNLLPRIAATPDFFECRMCAWAVRCWGLAS
jgi:hypothetical protein